jgi:orotate phosphoribosyltransferase
MRPTEERTLELLRGSGSLLEGHFKLTSGLHSGEYCQCARALERPEVALELGGMLAGLFPNLEVDVVASPALGGILVGHEVARALGVRSIFAERQEGEMTFRRGFAVAPGERVLIVEDVMTTGGSVREVAALVAASGARVVGFGFILDRSASTPDLAAPVRALLRRHMEAHEPDRCPLCAAAVPIAKPGSRPDRSAVHGGKKR